MKRMGVELPDGYMDVAPGKLANVATFLEMRRRPPPRPDPPGVTSTLRRVDSPDADWYLALFHKIGDPYLWFSRLNVDRAALEAILSNPNQEVYAVEDGGDDEGLLELDFGTPGECELLYFGLAAKLVGTGTGRWLMNRALERAWRKPIARFWVHTCSLDHPAALAFYRRSGFEPYARKIEIADDPRLTGLIPRDAAPQIPLL
jgi:GNAT superfamily N-acetyltransferase